MMSSWWFLWVAFMFVFLATPIGYGSGYRGWGPPYPRYIQRRRGPPRDANGVAAATTHHLSWGWGGDFVWVALLISVLWVATALCLPLWMPGGFH